MATLPILVGSDEDWEPSTYMHDVRVEIAFNAGYVTPSADRVWTDVSQWVEFADRIPVGVGRSDERSVADANDLTVTLDNTDGRFTARRSGSPYFPNVKVGRPIRVSVLTATGHTSVRFVGFVDEWPVEWDGTDAYAKANIRASSRLSRLGLTAKLRSLIENEIVVDSPLGYWTLGDAAGAVEAQDSSGRAAPVLRVVDAVGADMTFGTGVGPSTDELSAAQFASPGDYLQTPTALVPTMSTNLAAEFWMVPTPLTGGDPILRLRTNTGDELRVMYSGVGDTSVLLNGATVLSATGAGGGLLRHVALEVDRSDNSLRLFVNGALSSSAAATPVLGTSSVVVTVGEAIQGTMAHVAIYDSLPGLSRFAAHRTAGVDGFLGERTDQRVSRILSWVGVAATEVDAELGAETMTYQLTSGMSAVDAARECESTEGGVLFDGPDGKVHFHNRSRRYTATAAVTLDMAAQHVGADFAPRLDRSTLLNDVTVQNPTTGTTVRATDTASSDEYGVATGSTASASDVHDSLVQKAAWLIASYAEPRPRVPSLTVDVLAHVGLTPSADDLLQVGVGDRIDVINAPAQADSTTASYFVEGYTEDIGPESHFITFNLSPTYPALSTFVLDDAVRGVLDTSILGY